MGGNLDSSRLSKTAVRKAGSRFRRIETQRINGEAVDIEYRQSQLRIIEKYRAQFSIPLNSMNSSLRSYLSSMAVSGEVTQRLKRMPTIIDKIVSRESLLDLSRMRDIGGCRVVIEEESTDQLYRLADYVERRNANCKRVDYVAEPRASGYRALHLEIERSELPIEVQLRTPNMHQWAETAEAFGDILGPNYKSDGDTIVHRFMRLRMELDRSLEQALVPEPSLMSEIALLTSEINDLLKRTVTFDERGG